MIEGPGIEPTDVLLWIALATIVVPAIFLIVVVIAAIRVARGTPASAHLTSAVALLGGASLGTFLLFGTEPLIGVPILAASVLLVVGRLRAQRRVQAGWLIAGIGLPWTVLWGIYVAALATGSAQFDPVVTIVGFAAGALVIAAGAVLAVRGDPGAISARMTSTGSRPPRG